MSSNVTIVFMNGSNGDFNDFIFCARSTTSGSSVILATSPYPMS